MLGVIDVKSSIESPLREDSHNPISGNVNSPASTSSDSSDIALSRERTEHGEANLHHEIMIPSLRDDPSNDDEDCALWSGKFDHGILRPGLLCSLRAWPT